MRVRLVIKRGEGITFSFLLFFWVDLISAIQYICKSKPSPWLLELFNCSWFSSHPASLSTLVSLFSMSTSEAELGPQLHVFLHFPWQHDLTHGQLCYAAWIFVVAPRAVCADQPKYGLWLKSCVTATARPAPHHSHRMCNAIVYTE